MYYEILIFILYIHQVFLVIHYRPIVEELADIILSADVETVEAIQHRYGEQVDENFIEQIDLLWLVQISYSQAPTALEVCLAKSEPIEENDETNEAGICFCSFDKSIVNII
jgi:hypothetical protein